MTIGRPKKSGLESAKARKAFELRSAPYWIPIGERQQLGYRKGAKEGYWLVRFTSKAPRKKVQESLGVADDLREADGKEVLTFYQASEMARAWCKRMEEAAKPAVAPPSNRNTITVSQAMEAYLEYLYAERKSGEKTEQAAWAHILKHPIALRPVVDLTADEIKKFRQGIVDMPRGSRLKPGRLPVKDRPRRKNKDGTEREIKKGKWELAEEGLDPKVLKAKLLKQRKSTANRVLSILKGALNKLKEKDPLIDDRQWRAVKPFKKVDGKREEYLEVVDQRKLIEACPPGFRELVMGALYTGARYGELQALKVGKVFIRSNTIKLEDTKTNEPRDIPLTAEASRFFAKLIEGRRKTQNVFLKSNGEPWGKSHTFRPLRAACDAAGVTPLAFHELRHTYASHLVMAGIELVALAKILGHADTRMVQEHYGHLRQGWVHEQLEKHALPLFPEEEESTRLVETQPVVEDSTRPVETKPVVEASTPEQTERRRVKVYTKSGNAAIRWSDEPPLPEENEA